MSPSETPEPNLTVSGEQAGTTLSSLVREMVPGTSWNQARELCRGGRASINGKAETDPARRLAAGDRVELRLTGPARPRVSAAEEAIVHLDAEVVVVRKDAGVLTVPFTRADKDTLLSRTRAAARRLDTARGSADRGPTLRAVQRLDKDTSGLVVFARSVAAQRHLQEQFSGHSVLRRYLAIVYGRTEAATYDTMLLPDRGDGLRGSWGVLRPGIGTPPPTARAAVTYVKVVEQLQGATLVACELETGRQHQIRIHLAEAGHPLIGETVYIRDYRGARIAAPRPMLHAAVLGFVHPRSGRPLRFEDPPPADFAGMLEKLRRSGPGGKRSGTKGPTERP